MPKISDISTYDAEFLYGLENMIERTGRYPAMYSESMPRERRISMTNIILAKSRKAISQNLRQGRDRCDALMDMNLYVLEPKKDL